MVVGPLSGKVSCWVFCRVVEGEIDLKEEIICSGKREGLTDALIMSDTGNRWGAYVLHVTGSFSDSYNIHSTDPSCKTVNTFKSLEAKIPAWDYLPWRMLDYAASSCSGLEYRFKHENCQMNLYYVTNQQNTGRGGPTLVINCCMYAMPLNVGMSGKLVRLVRLLTCCLLFSEHWLTIAV